MFSWTKNHGLLGGCRASFEDTGIFFMFYRSHMFLKNFQGSYFLPYSHILKYNEGYDETLRILFNKGSVFFPLFDIYNKKSPNYKLNIRCIKRLIMKAGVNKITHENNKSFKKDLLSLEHRVHVNDLKQTSHGRRKLKKEAKKNK